MLWNNLKTSDIPSEKLESVLLKKSNVVPLFASNYRNRVLVNCDEWIDPLKLQRKYNNFWFLGYNDLWDFSPRIAREWGKEVSNLLKESPAVATAMLQPLSSTATSDKRRRSVFFLF